MEFSKTRFAGIVAATTAAVAYGVYRFRGTDENDSGPVEADEDAPAASA
jgi:hypothetical protein